MSELVGLLAFLAFWLGSFLLLAVAIFALRHVYTSRGWRSFAIPFALFEAVFLIVVGTLGFGSIIALIVTIPVGIIVFAVTLLAFTCNSWISGGVVSVARRTGADTLFPGLLPDDESPETRDYSKTQSLSRSTSPLY